MLELKIAEEHGIVKNSPEWNALIDVVTGKSTLGDAAFFYGADFNCLCGIVEETKERRNMAAALGRKGGQAKSEKKSASSKENGKKGGRPKKQVK